MYYQEGSSEGERKAGHGIGRTEQGGYTQSGQRERRREITSSRLIACCGCVSQLEELILLEVSALEAARESLAEMIGQVDEVVSGGGPVSRSVCSLPSLCTSPAKPCPVPAGRASHPRPVLLPGECGDLDDRRHSDPGHRRAVI